MPTKKTPAKKPAKPVPAGAAPPTLPFRLEAVQARTLTPNPQNWRTHPDRQLSALSAVLKDPEVGWAGALLFNERTGRLVDGHGRLKVVDPDDYVPVLIGSWSEAAEKKILLTLDPLAGLATADAGQLETLRGCVDDLDGDPFKGLNAELDDLLKDAKREEKQGSGGSGGGEGTPTEPTTIAGQWKIIIDCKSEEQQAELIEEFTSRGLSFTAPSV